MTYHETIDDHITCVVTPCEVRKLHQSLENSHGKLAHCMFAILQHSDRNRNVNRSLWKLCCKVIDHEKHLRFVRHLQLASTITASTKSSLIGGPSNHRWSRPQLGHMISKIHPVHDAVSLLAMARRKNGLMATYVASGLCLCVLLCWRMLANEFWILLPHLQWYMPSSSWSFAALDLSSARCKRSALSTDRVTISWS